MIPAAAKPSAETDAVETAAPEIGQGRATRFIRDVLLSNIPLPFQQLRAYLWLALFSRAFGPKGYGMWSLFFTALTTAVSFASMAQGYSMMRFLSGDRSPEDTNRGFSSVIAAITASTLLVAAVLVAFSHRLSELTMHSVDGRQIFLLVALIVPFDTYFEEIKGFLRARRLNRTWAFFILGRQVPEGLLLIAVAVWWFGTPLATIKGYLLTSVLSVAIGWFFLYRYHGIRLVRPSRSLMAKYIPYGLILIPGALAASLSFTADRYLVAYYQDVRQVGIYSVCYSASVLGFFFCGPLNDVLLPEMSALYEEGSFNQLYTRFAAAQKVSLALATGAAALLFSFPREILRLLASRDFSSGGAALSILGLQGIFMSVILVYIVLFCVELRGRWTTGIWAIMGVLVLAIDLVLVPRIGIVGAAFGQTVSSLAGAGLVIGLNWRAFRRTFRLRWLPQLGISFVGVWALASLWRTGGAGPGRTLTGFGLCGLAYLGLLLVTRYTGPAELAVLMNGVRRRP